MAGSALAQTAPSGAGRMLLEEGRRLATEGRTLDAALVFQRIVAQSSDDDAGVREAQYDMGVALFELGLHAAAYGFFDRIAEIGSSHPKYYHILPWLVRIHDRIPGETSSLARMSMFPPNQYPPEVANDINLHVGQYHFDAGNLAAALDSLSRVTTQSPGLHIKAQYLKGVVEVRKNDPAAAAETFQGVLRFVKDKGLGGGENERMTQMTLLALGRVFYGSGQHASAIRYYDAIPDGTSFWLDSLFERSWAYYQTQQFARAMGNIQTVAAPYFETEYYPEVFVLKSVILFMNCRYDEALAVIDPFYKEHYDIMKEIEAVLAARPQAADFYQYLAGVSVKGADYSLKVKKIFNAALADQKLRNRFLLIVELGDEMARMEALRTQPVAQPLVAFLLPRLAALRTRTIGEAGQMARDRLVRVNKELKSLLSQGLKVRFECLNAQKGLLDEALRQEQVAQVQARDSETVRLSADAEHVRWAFDGEYWKDELGFYYYPLTSLCGGTR